MSESNKFEIARKWLHNYDTKASTVRAQDILLISASLLAFFAVWFVIISVRSSPGVKVLDDITVSQTTATGPPVTDYITLGESRRRASRSNSSRSSTSSSYSTSGSSRRTTPR